MASNKNERCPLGMWELCGSTTEVQEGIVSRLYGPVVYKADTITSTYMAPRYFNGGCYAMPHRVPWTGASQDLNGLFDTSDPFQAQMPGCCDKPQ